MRSLRTAVAAVSLVMGAFVLAACSGGDTPTAPAADPTVAVGATNDASDPTAAGTPAAASGGTCPTVPQGGYELSSSDVFSAVPESGAVWGDGTPISWTFADGGAHIIGVDMSYVNDAGDAIPMSGIFLDDMGGGTVSSSLLVFDSDTDGRPGFMTLTETDGTKTETLGVYCVTFKVSE